MCSYSGFSLFFSGNNQRTKKVRKNPREEAESSLDLSYFVANVTSSNIRYDSLNLPMRFVRANGVDTRCGEMILINENGKSWTVDLKRKKSCGTTYIRRGWRSFCHANGLRAGSSFTFKLIQRGATLCLRLSPRELKEEDCLSEPETNQDERSSQECTKRKFKNCFVTVTLTPYNIEQSKLVLPIPFTKVNDIVKAKKMSLLDKHGVKWSIKLWFEVERKRMRLVGGWKEFCYANGVKIGESIILELIWETEESSVLKFCSKVHF
ncbi:putative B3 domain-containing protein REM15 [Arabidopsis lyrata subsp. lyrata]|uniref:putative B3 domain-containing protein REM15 n=1 Tax=Arabidopsis lyrata subsp. lyrata TaxID=81972 RepID=UPI000A29D7EA|nr:putative B3 domain-containing protein REM15 [Arabidopsis lyrata subsp. lyrata]|eukprot:XP_020888131.1 putative B3 domain-containing protein REM15 [Arabidopsis lyrata subsp. lyrata]